jgi:DNA adenine methylase
LVPHPFPYQGSKRRLAPAILHAIGPLPPGTRFVEPFVGSGAMSLAVARVLPTARFWLNDALVPLAGLWRAILDDPRAVAEGYRALWAAGDQPTTVSGSAAEATFEDVRARFNASADPVLLLYLLARCVKGAVRFNRRGDFNQAPDRRRRGMEPARMGKNLDQIAKLLVHRTVVSARDAGAVLTEVGAGDFVYLDPPYEGTSTGHDRRYVASFERARVVELAASLRARGVGFALSYDGRRGERAYGVSLETELGLSPRWLDAGRSSQSTLLGRSERTVEALYVYTPPSFGRGRP